MPASSDTAAILSDARARLAAAFGGPAQASHTLLDWYDRHARDLPWRAPPGAAARPEPYRVWLSEIMLQQTTVATVKDYFERFVARWPAVGDLAAAPLEDVLHAWQGLGYYARARNLHRCARAVVQDHGGVFPDTEDGLRALPGIGAYTAAAIAAIAFDRPATVVDGNVERVMARLHGVETPLPDAKPVLRRLAALTAPDDRPGDYAQATMDLGATVCTARSPKCLLCPWSGGLRRASPGHRGRAAAPGGEEGETGAPRHRVVDRGAGRAGHAAPPARKRPARRHDGVPRHRLDRSGAHWRAAHRHYRGTPRRIGQPCLYPFPAGTRGADGARRRLQRPKRSGRIRPGSTGRPCRA